MINEKMAICLPAAVERIICTLEDCGYEAYAVGGCVRDAVLGKTPEDWDICTSALPDETKRCFEDCRLIETGLKHGTVTIIIDHIPYEVTTYRVDGIYTDHRHPDQVAFVRRLRQDLARRDFSMNAMAYHPVRGMADYFDGIRDIGMKTVRCVGSPDQRFHEDALRMMRALRFAAVFNFTVEPETANSIHKNRELLREIAAERIQAELRKLLAGPGVGRILKEFADVLAVWVPEIEPTIGFAQRHPYHNCSLWEHTVCSIERAAPEIKIRLAMLFHDLAKPACFTLDQQGIGHFCGHAQKSAQMAAEIMKRLKMDRETLHHVRELVFYHDVQLSPGSRQIKRWLNRLGEERLRMLLEVQRADILSQSPIYREERLMRIAQTEKMLETVLEQKQCFALKDLSVNGRDLIDAGIAEGPIIGDILHHLLDQVLNEELPNDRQALLEAAAHADCEK